MIIHDQTNTLLKEKNLLFNYQSGFKTNHLTNLCSSFLKDKIVKEFNEGLLVEMILIDHQKAFDSFTGFNPLAFAVSYSC